MAREPDVALLLTSITSAHKKRIRAHKILKVKTFSKRSLRFKDQNREIRVRFTVKIIFL